MNALTAKLELARAALAGGDVEAAAIHLETVGELLVGSMAEAERVRAGELAQACRSLLALAQGNWSRRAQQNAAGQAAANAYGGYEPQR